MSWTTTAPGGRRRLELGDPLEHQRVDDRLQHPRAGPRRRRRSRPPSARSSSPSAVEHAPARTPRRPAARPGVPCATTSRASWSASITTAPSSRRIADTVLLPEATAPVSPTRTSGAYCGPCGRMPCCRARRPGRPAGPRVAGVRRRRACALLAAGVFPIPLDPRLTADERDADPGRPRPDAGRRGRPGRWRRSVDARCRRPLGCPGAGRCTAPAAPPGRPKGVWSRPARRGRGRGPRRRGARAVGLRRPTTSTWCSARSTTPRRCGSRWARCSPAAGSWCPGRFDPAP